MTTPKALVRQALEGFGGSKVDFQRATGISISTINHFEDGTNRGSRPLVVLLMILAQHPEAARGLCAGVDLSMPRSEK